MANVIETGSLETEAVALRLMDAGFKAVAPMYQREIRHSRRVTRRLYPLYSRYIFAWVGHDVGRALRIRGVVNVLRKAGSVDAAVVDDGVVKGVTSVASVANFKLGDKLTVMSGKMEGLSGLFHREENERVFLLLSMLGKEIEMPFHKSVLVSNPHAY